MGRGKEGEVAEVCVCVCVCVEMIGQMPRLSLIKATPLQRLHRRLHEYKTAELGLVILFDRHFNPHV